MYRLGQRHKFHRRLILVIVIGLIIVGVIIIYGQLRQPAQPVISTSPSVTSTLSTGTANPLPVETAMFTTSLPPAWKTVKSDPANGRYSYQGTTEGDSSRLIDIYIDKIPAGLAVNRLVALKPTGAGVDHGSVSDNCLDFTSQAAQVTPEAVATKTALAAWQNVAFLCDIGNVNRNVVGASAIGPINSVVLQGQKTGRHSVFFTYMEQNFNPNYNAFYTMLENFKLK